LRRKVFRFLCGDGENRSAGILSEAAAAKALERLDANAANSDDGWFSRGH
jgi:hypothetical protein